MNLNEAQKLFKKNLLAPEADPQALQSLKPAGKLSLEQAFEIYHNGYVSRLEAVLTRTYPAVLWVVGKDLFESLCHRYIETQPSVNYDLHAYGKNFPEFVRATSQTRGIPFLYDLARFEWAYQEIYHAPTPDPLPLDRVQELSASDDYRVQFIEALEIFSSPYAIYEIWYRREEPPYRFENIDWNHAESLLIYKKNRQIEILPVDNIEADILLELKEGSSIASALADFAGLLSPDHVAQFLHLLLNSGIIDDIIILEE